MLLPFQGVNAMTIRNPGCRFACPGLCAYWAFSPCIIGGTSTIQASLIVFGLHENSARALSAAPQQFSPFGTKTETLIK